MATRTHAGMIAIARDMRENLYSYRDIGTYLGVDPSTVQCWLNPAANEAHAAKTRRQRAQQFLSTPRQCPSKEYLLARAEQLRAAELGFRSIAALFRVDYGLALTDEQIKYALKSGRWPKEPRYTRVCEGCGKAITASRPDAQWCSSKCRNRPNRDEVQRSYEVPA